MNDIELKELPDQVKEFVTVIGLEDSLRLVSMYGGVTITFTDDRRTEVGSRRDLIERVLGKKKAGTFFKHFANRSIYIPRCSIALKRVRDRSICRDSDAGASIPELCMKYAPLSDRQIWRILKASADIFRE